MKKIVIFCFLFVSAFWLTSYAKPSEQTLDKIVAVVNDDVVTKSELNQALAIVKMQIAQQQLPALSESALQKQVLDQLINKKLQLQMAKQAGVRVTDNDLNEAIANVAKQNNISVSSLYQRLNQEGMSTTDYRNEIRDQLILHKLQQQEVISHINISPEEVAAFSRSKGVTDDTGPKEFLVEDILIPLSDTPSSDEVTDSRKRAETLLTRLRKGDSLRDIALAEKNVKHRIQSEDLGWRKLSEIPSLFVEQVGHMRAKEVAGPIQAGNGFHILVLKNLRSSGGAKEAQLNKKQIEDLLLQRKFEEALQTWVSRLRSQAYIVKNA